MRSLAIAVGLTFIAAPAFAADPVEGEWLVQDKGGKVRIAPCPRSPERMCGATTWVKDATKVMDEKNPNAELRQKPLMGQQVMRDFKQAAPGRWTGGKIYDPKSGKTYDSKITANANGSLKVEGCVLMVCQAQTWTRN
ncbi:MAG: DUF2147 domain-containing protein [Phenylobacterium sp.]